MGRNESCVCFNRWGTAAYLKFVNLIFQPNPKLKAAIEICLVLHSMQGWHSAETDQQLPAFTSSHAPASGFHKILSEYTASVLVKQLACSCEEWKRETQMTSLPSFCLSLLI